MVPREVRSALVARTVDSDDVLQGMSIPVLAMHGTADRISLPSMTEHILNICPTAQAPGTRGSPRPLVLPAAFAAERAHDSRVWTTLAL